MKTMKTKIKFFALLIAICSVVCAVFAGCLSTEDYEAIYNDDAKIAECFSCTRVGSVETSFNDTYKLTCKSISGVYEVMSITVSESSSVTLSFEVTSGKSKIVLINGDDVYTVAEGSYSGTLDTQDLPNGKYKLKIVSVEAQISLNICK